MSKALPALARHLAAVLAISLALASTAYAAWYASITPLEPAALDLQPIITFLNDSHNQEWRYLTLGFSDQMGLLAAQTNAGSIDGDYNTARRQPLLTKSGIEKIDTIRYWDPQAKVLRAYLQDPAPSNLRWIFANEDDYNTFLREAGWRQTTLFSDGVKLWEPPAIPPPISPLPASSTGIKGIWWGSAPIASLIAWLALDAWTLSTCFQFTHGQRKNGMQTGEQVRFRTPKCLIYTGPTGAAETVASDAEAYAAQQSMKGK